jgi:hypothetical protein
MTYNSSNWNLINVINIIKVIEGIRLIWIMACGNLHKCLQYLYRILFEGFIRLCILPVINTICPVMDVRVKYFIICRHAFKRGNATPGLTIELWDSYVKYISKISKSTMDNAENINLDYFDLLFKPKLAKINRQIKMRISSMRDEYIGCEESEICIDFREFCRILEEVLGTESVRFRYRYTQDTMLFVSIFGDDGPYRRFRWCDWI